MNDDEIPHWACRDWGQYEHDWLDCCECLEGYVKYLGNEINSFREGDQIDLDQMGEEEISET